MNTLLLAGINDNLRLLVWAKTKDGQKGKNQPESILSKLVGNNMNEREEVVFDSGEDFTRMRKQLIGDSTNGGEE